MANSDEYQFYFKEIQCDPEKMAQYAAQDGLFFAEEESQTRWKKQELKQKLWDIVEKIAKENLTKNQWQYWELAKKGYTTQRISAVISTLSLNGKIKALDDSALQEQRGMTKSGYIPAGVKYGNFITCRICGKYLSQIHVNHLKKYHLDVLGFKRVTNLSSIGTKEVLGAYIKMFPDAPIYTNKKNDELGIVTQQGLWDRKRNALKKLQKLLQNDERVWILLREIQTVDVETLY